MKSTARNGAALFAMLFLAGQVLGHGNPIGVNTADGKLIAVDGTPDAAGYAPLIFINAEEDGEMDHVNLPVFGKVALTSLPGFDISGMDTDSGLYLSPFARPVGNATPDQTRLLWHWNAATQTVMIDPNDEMMIVASESGQISIRQSGGPIPSPLKVANPDPEDIGQHVHFLRYLLDDDPLAASGAYGFFARLSSPNYMDSEPLLVIFNNGLDSDQLTSAALAINAAAFLPGDFNHDDVVDAADYTVWRDGLDNGYTSDQYQIWKDHFGQSLSSDGGGAIATTIPEAGCIPLVIGALLALLASRAKAEGTRRSSDRG
jgi:hypothetical protein